MSVIGAILASSCLFLREAALRRRGLAARFLGDGILAARHCPQRAAVEPGDHLAAVAEGLDGAVAQQQQLVGETENARAMRDDHYRGALRLDRRDRPYESLFALVVEAGV